MSGNSDVEHCQSCVLGVLSVSKWERLWRVTVWRPIALLLSLYVLLVESSDRRWRGAISGGGERSQVEASDHRWK